jgi:hypothetical protein
MKTIQIVPIEFIHQAWEKCGYMVENAMAHAKGECTAEQLKVLLVQGQHHLMLFLEDKDIVGAVEFMYDDSPNARLFYINALGGKTCKEHMDQMYAFAKSMGCTAVRFCCRESVARLSKQKYDFESIYTMMERKL